MFLEANEHEIKNPKSIRKEITDDALKRFNTISTRVFKIKNATSGLNDFYPLSFDSLHFSCLTISIHSAIVGNLPTLHLLIDFKFRKRMLNDFKEGETAYKTLENLRVTRLNPKQSKLLSKKKNTKRKFQNLTEFLFSEDKDDEESIGYLPIEVDHLEIERMHQVYI